MEAIDLEQFERRNPVPAPAHVPAVRVLVADDDADMRALIARPLRRRGFQVIEKADGNGLLDYIAGRMNELNGPVGANLPPQFIVVTDIRMPGCDGLTIVSGMRRWGWRVPVILVSAVDDDFVADQVADLSVAAFFRKPFDPRLLAFFIQSMVDSPS